MDYDQGSLFAAAATDAPRSDFVLATRGCGCAFCGRVSVDDPTKTDSTTATGVSDTIPANVSTTGTLTAGSSVSGSISPTADRDWYAISLTAGQQYTFNLNGASGAMSALNDPYLYLYNSAGSLVTSDDDSGPGTNSQITYTATTTGTYYLAAGSYNDVGTGSYTLSSSAGTAPPPPGSTNPLDSINWGTQVTPTSGVIYVYFATTGQTFNGRTADRSWNSTEIAASMHAFQQYSNVINVTFQQTTNQAQAHFTLVQSAEASSTLGTFVPPGGGNSGNGWFNNSQSSWSTSGLQQGGYAYVTLLHEFGHGMGLAHPHDTGGSSTIMEGVTASSGSYGVGSLNQGIFTTMSYNDGWASGPNVNPFSNDYGWQGTMMALDVASLQADYGANTSYHTGADTYTIADTNAAGTFYTCIWDAGGTDGISYSGTRAATIDLRAATLLQAEGGGGYVSYVTGIYGGFTIANGVVIENATGGSGADTITGNSAANTLSGGGGSDTLTGGAGNDSFVYTAGADTITDFTAGGTDDSINLSAFSSLTSFSAIMALAAQVGANTVFTFSSGNTLTLTNVTLGNLTAADFGLSDSVNTITGTSGADPLTGTSGVDNISGLGGNDTINGLGGGDTIAGGDNDDTIYYYATDTWANITGGNGTDTLLIVNGSAPTSLNLTAQGFESAQHYQTDGAGAQTWATITDTYNTSWQVLTSDRMNDDSTRALTTYDRGALTWNYRVEQFNAAGSRTEQQTYNDDSTRNSYYWDALSNQTWREYGEDYNAAGQRTIQRIYNDDTSYRFFYWDPTNAQTWTNFDDEFNAAGQRHTERIVYDGGNTRNFYWDVTSTQTWTTFDEEFTSGGVRSIQRIQNDDGTTSQQFWDTNNSQTYSTYVDYMNAAGQRVEQRIFHDAGGYTRVYYDPTNIYPWSTQTDVYNAAGVLTSSSQVPG